MSAGTFPLQDVDESRHTEEERREEERDVLKREV